MQRVLQTGLTAGMSATEGFHSNKPTPVDPSFDGSKELMHESFIPSKDTPVTLRGKNGDIKAPCINIGAWSWGDTATWQWSPEEVPAVKEAWKILRDGGINWIDTAQAYGSGESERICGDLVEGLPRDSYIMQTKWYVVPDNAKNIFSPVDAPVQFLKETLERMRLSYIDVYLVHGHIHASSIAQVAEGLAKCVDQGLTKTVGVANYSEEDMIQMSDELAKYGIPLATNQCEFSLLRRYPETHGLLRACKDRGIIFQSYSSVAQGRLTGKYSAENPPPKTHRFSSYDMKDIQSTIDILTAIGKAHGVNPTTVALNYNMSKGVVPTIGIRKPQHAKDAVAALGWRLSTEEISRLEKVSMEGSSTILWQQG